MSRPGSIRTRLCEELGVEHPVLLAGMGLKGLATPPALVAAVSEAGGLGVMGCSWTPPETVRERIGEVRRLTKKPFGVDLLLPASMDPGAVPDWGAMRARIEREYPRHVAFVDEVLQEHGLERESAPPGEVLAPESIRASVEVVLQERVPVFAAGLGDPAWVVPLARAAGTKVMGLAGSLRHAQRHRAAGVDYVIAQGSEAGGHTGTVTSLTLWPQVVDAVSPLPVIAAGGIGDGRGLVAALALGCVGAWVGTAFLLSEESRIHLEHKRQIAGARSEDFVVTRAYTGKTGRDFRNDLIRRWEASGLEALPMPLQSLVMEDLLHSAARAGRYDLLNNPAGQVGGMLDTVRPAREIFSDLVEGARRTLDALWAMAPAGASADAG